jgi:hypothetical protein
MQDGQEVKEEVKETYSAEVAFEDLFAFAFDGLGFGIAGDLAFPEPLAFFFGCRKSYRVPCR